jgi:hypothetical protein
MSRGKRATYPDPDPLAEQELPVLLALGSQKSCNDEENGCTNLGYTIVSQVEQSSSDESLWKG